MPTTVPLPLAPHAVSNTSPKIALALAGGGFLGAAYELGVLAALAECVEGLDLNNLSSYVGVSAGAYLAAGLVNGLTPHQMVRIFVEAEDSETPLAPEALLRPAYAQIAAALLKFPKKSTSVAKHLNPFNFAPWRFIEEMGRALPHGFIDPTPAAKRMSEMFAGPGRSNDFKSFNGRLRILATDIDSGKSIEFGAPGFEDTPISTALSASSAVPGLFVPVEINGRRYLDGAVNKTLHASVALAEGADLVICLNPLVPYAPTDISDLKASSLPSILSQTLRTLIRSRMAVGLEKYSATYPKAHIWLLEPKSSDASVFMTSMFSLKGRRNICELAYQQTRNDLQAQRLQLGPLLARCGLRLRQNLLEKNAPALVGAKPRKQPRKPKTIDAAAKRLKHALEDLERKVLMR
jgi:NTE family protein